MHFSAADYVCISGFWGLQPRLPPGLCPFRPWLPETSLPPNPSFATVVHTIINHPVGLLLCDPPLEGRVSCIRSLRQSVQIVQIPVGSRGNAPSMESGERSLPWNWSSFVLRTFNVSISCTVHTAVGMNDGHEYKPASGQVHQDLISPIQSCPFVSKELAKCFRMSSSKTAKLPLLNRHLLTAVNQLTGSLWIL